MPKGPQGQKPSVAMIGLRAVLFVAVALAGRGVIMDALRGQPTAWSFLVIAIMCGLAVYVILDLRKRYA
jgi:hypothetical protein